MKIRSYTRGDCEAVTALNRELGYDGTAAEMQLRLETVLASPEQAVFVAEAGGSVSGWIHMAVVPSIETDSFAEIRGLVVAAAARRTGIGAALVASGEGWARDQGMTRVRVRSNVTREDARRFYEKLGYRVTKTQNVFDRDVPAPD